jgi:hypothetical protein
VTQKQTEVASSTTPLCCTAGFPAPRYCNRATTSWAGSSYAVGPSQECLPVIDVAMARYGDDEDFSMVAPDEASFGKHLLGLGPRRWKQCQLPHSCRQKIKSSHVGKPVLPLDSYFLMLRSSQERWQPSLLRTLLNA